MTDIRLTEHILKGMHWVINNYVFPLIYGFLLCLKCITDFAQKIVIYTFFFFIRELC